jgi:hypothetical protein
MSGSFAPLSFGEFKAPDLIGMANARQTQSLNAMREDQLLQQSGQLRAAEGEKNSMRALFSRTDFDPFSPDGAKELLRVAPTTGAATFQALMRARADDRAGQASLRAGAASERAAAASERQARTALTENEIKSITLGQSLLIPIRDLPEADRPRAYATWLAGMDRRIPGFSASAPREYSDAGYYALLSKASEIVAREAERAKPAPGFTLSPGQTRFDATGQPIASSAARDPAREEKINDIMDTFNVDRRTAVGIESGVLRPIVDPVTGQTRLIDLTNNTFRETTPAPAAPAPAPAPLVVGPRANTPAPAAAPTVAVPTNNAEPQRTLYQLADIPRTTGVGPLLADIAQGVTGQVGINLPGAGDLIERRQVFSNAQGELIRALSVNPRYPVAEQERLREEINIGPGAFIDPVKLKARLRSVGNSLRVRLSNEERAANDASLPPEQRRNAAAAVTDIRNFLAVLGAPERDEAPPPRPRGATIRPAGATPGAQPGEIRTPSGFTLRPIQ